jgi:hypothetical protein
MRAQALRGLWFYYYKETKSGARLVVTELLIYMVD